MHFKSQIDGWFKIVIWFSIAIMITTLICIPKDEYLIGFSVGIPMIISLLWIYYGSYFEIRDTYLLCKVGPFSERIYYDQVESVKMGEGILISMALSREYIEIKHSKKRNDLVITYISPLDREEFVKELRKRCYNLK
ncbi:PH domain-containing protein [Alkalibacter mobilis]|uniref:PH domain-containing protein n=1 Tax=Alkalibacter mobilis TaxID=2787712 RepID=UPI00189D79F6|nr:PH domain-containing protein [Alkalibacter mobilis]MBF7095908.1 PH domain-containing protein [Alkalibacter mobilis]